MRCIGMRLMFINVAITGVCSNGFAQQVLTWNQVQQRFLTANPTLQAGQLTIEEAKANEVTAGLRPNPQLSISTDQYQFYSSGGTPFRPLTNSQIIPIISQLWERKHKRELRVDSARFSTAGSRADTADLERNLLFNLHDAFNRVLQGKSLLELARDNLQYYDRVISVNQERFKAGDISKVDYERVELQRVQFESDLASADVNLRTAKIQLLSLLNDRTPVESFDVSGNFDYSERLLLLPELRQMALDTRPDLTSAKTAVEKARVENRLAFANGSADPTIGAEYLWNSQVHNTLGMSVNIPLRIFDKNQGEKARTAVEIRRSEHLQEGVLNSVYRDVDSSYAQLESVRSLLRPYRQKYLDESKEIRDLISFSFSQGGASLLEFLDAQKSYRDTQLSYRNLVGSYLSALAQLSLAVGQEVTP
jgi:cobalt-zinc-cadmium efflux system outer membrane protein